MQPSDGVFSLYWDSNAFVLAFPGETLDKAPSSFYAMARFRSAGGSVKPALIAEIRLRGLFSTCIDR